MPTYHLYCETCATQWSHTQSIFDALPTTHFVLPEGKARPCGPVVQVLHPPTIFGVGASGSAVALKDASAKQRERDVDAYKRLRKNGVQPATVADSAEIEARANEPIEVERNTAFEHKGLRRRMQAAANEAAVTQAVA